MRTFSFSVLLTLLALAACIPETRQPEATIATRIDSLMQSLHEQDRFNGNVLVARAGEIIYQQSLGWAERAPDRPLEAETPFYLGSLAKQFTGMVMMQLAHQGRLSLDDQLGTYFPELPAFAREIRLHQMLHHLSGLPDYYDAGAFHPGMTNQEVLDFVMALDSLDFAPGTAYAYSNTAYVLLSMVAEQAAGTSFGHYLQAQVFEPLGMSHSYVYERDTVSIPGRAVGYTSEWEEDDYHAFTTGGGGIFSTTGDLLRWEQALYGEELLPQERLQAAYQPARLAHDSLSYYGYGWNITPGHPERLWHTGSLAGFRTFMYRDLDSRIFILLLSNHTDAPKPIGEDMYRLLTSTDSGN